MIRKIIEFSARRSTVTEVVTGVVTGVVMGAGVTGVTWVVVTEDVVGLDPVGTEVPIRVPGAVGVVAVIAETVGAGTAGVTPGRGTLP